MLQKLPRATNSVHSAPQVLSEERLGANDVILFVRRYAPSIGACILGFLILGQIYVAVTASSFVASTQVVIESRRGNLAGGDVSFAQYSLDSSQMESQIQIIKSEQIAKRVVQGLNLDQDPDLTRSGGGLFSAIKSLFVTTPAPPTVLTKASPAVRALADRLQARRMGQSYVIEISYWAGDPETASRICNSITAAYIGDLLQNKINDAEAGNEILERRISTLRAQGEAAAKAVRTGHFDTETFPSADARVITTALPPESRSWPRGSLVLAFSGLLGLFVGLFGAAVHRGLDTSLHTRDEIARTLELETLGSLPRMYFRKFHKLASEVTQHPTSAFGTTVRQIRATIQLRQADTSLRCIGITSATEGEGKTILAANLAQAAAAAGSRVLLVDGDVHQGTLTKKFTPDAALGLIDMIDGGVAVGSALIRMNAWEVDFLPVQTQVESRRAIELPSGERMGDFLAVCRKHYDVVLVDLPALETGPDAKAISPQLDGMIFVVQAGGVRSERLVAALESLRVSDVAFIGAVITKSVGGSNV